MELPNIASLVTAAIQGLGDTASGLIKDFKTDPTVAAQLNEKLAEVQTTLTQSLEQEYTKQLEAVNVTMQEEDKSEHFLTYSWRPMVGYTFCLLVINNYILYPYLSSHGVVLLEIPQTVWITLGSILGVTAVGRTFEKINK